MEKQDVLKLAENQGGWSMSDFQSRYFVVNSQVTDYRRVRQALLEIETRIAAKKQIIRDTKRSEVKLKIKEKELIAQLDDLEKELILLDIDQFQYDISVYEKKLRIVEEELDEFAKLVVEIVPTIEELETYKEHNDELEREYWISRMAKQASVDILNVSLPSPPVPTISIASSTPKFTFTAKESKASLKPINSSMVILRIK